MAIEFARNVLGFRDADHAESSPDAKRLVIEPLACSLAGLDEPVRLRPGSRLASVYGADDAIESYFCAYGLAPEYEPLLEPRGLTVAARGQDGGARAVELEDHGFFLATLFLPQARSVPGAPHPVVAAFAAAAAASR